MHHTFFPLRVSGMFFRFESPSSAFPENRVWLSHRFQLIRDL